MARGTLQGEPEFKTFGEWLRHYRENHRPPYSLRVLAEDLLRFHKVDVSHAFIGNWERDDTPPEELERRPPVAFIEAVAAVLGADPQIGKRLGGYTVPDGAGPTPSDMTTLLHEIREIKQALPRQIREGIKEEIQDLTDILARVGPDVNITPFYRIPLTPTRASAGAALFPGETGEETVTLEEVLPPPDDLRAIRVNGECMAPFFRSGDILLVKPSPTADNGQKVIAHLDDDSVTCKIYRTNGEPYLEAAEPGYEPIPRERFRIVGVVVQSIRRE